MNNLSEPRTCDICQVGLPANGLEYRCYQVVDGVTTAEYVRYCGRSDCRGAVAPRNPPKLPNIGSGELQADTVGLQSKATSSKISPPKISFKLKKPVKPTKPKKPQKSFKLNMKTKQGGCMESQTASLIVKYQDGLPDELQQKGIMITFDGASKKGKVAGAGASLWSDNVLKRVSYCHLPSATNNQAEYTGLILGLELAVSYLDTRSNPSTIKKLTVVGDSKLVINQMSGAFEVRNLGLKKLYQIAMPLAQLFEGDNVQIVWKHAYRRFNTCADELANLGVKATKFVGVKNSFIRNAG